MGMTSILERLGTDDFPRLRVGIGRPPGQMQATNYVLQGFSKSDRMIISETLDRAVEAVLIIAVAGLDEAMNKYNGGIEK
jgi:PTH1 family peptidyl-tRNA hydrolase